VISNELLMVVVWMDIDHKYI
jgi:hypothetical protein